MSRTEHGGDRFQSGLTIDSLPDETICKIMGFLDVDSLCSAARTCHRWHNLVSSIESLWKRLCQWLYPGDKYIQYDRQVLGHTWKAAFIRNHGPAGVKRKWLEGEYSSVGSLTDLPAKSMCVMDVETWGEIFQRELDR